MSVTIDEAMNVTSVSGDVTKLTGYDPQELVGRNVDALIPEAMKARHAAGSKRWRETGEKRAMGSWLTVPLLRADGTELTVQLCLTERDGVATGLFTSDPDERLDPSEILQTIEARQAIEAEMRFARDIQASMLPRTFPGPPADEAIAIYAEVHPAFDVGGDFYDFDRVGDANYFFIVGDVSGKGVPAALFVGVVRALLRRELTGGADPGEAIARVNRQIAATNERAMFATVWVGLIDLETRTLRYSNAGHNPPLLVRAAGGMQKLRERHGVPIGVDERQTYGSSQLVLRSRDCLYVYTDGITEAEDPSGAPFGEDRLLEWAGDNATSGVESGIKNLIGRVMNFERGSERTDDLAVLGAQLLLEGG